MNAQELEEGLKQPRNGIEHWYIHPLKRRYDHTDGAQFLFEHAGAYWLLDLIAIPGDDDKSAAAIEKEDFQVWTLKVESNLGFGPATLSCDDGNGNIVYTKHIDVTDFPLPKVELWAQRNHKGGFTILLPTEY